MVFLAIFGLFWAIFGGGEGKLRGGTSGDIGWGQKKNKKNKQRKQRKEKEKKLKKSMNKVTKMTYYYIFAWWRRGNASHFVLVT